MCALAGWRCESDLRGAFIFLKFTSGGPYFSESDLRGALVSLARAHASQAEPHSIIEL